MVNPPVWYRDFLGNPRRYLEHGRDMSLKVYASCQFVYPYLSELVIIPRTPDLIYFESPCLLKNRLTVCTDVERLKGVIAYHSSESRVTVWLK